MARHEIPSLEALLAVGKGAPSVEQKVEFVQAIRQQSKDLGPQIDQFLIEDNTRLREGLLAAQANQEQLRAMLEKLGAIPWHHAVFLRPLPFETDDGPRAIIAHGNAWRVVGLADGITLDALTPGDDVFLGPELNVIMRKSPSSISQCGETACFERRISLDRLALQSRDEEIIVEIAESLRNVELQRGDLVRWNKNAWLAFEKIEREVGRQYLLDVVPDVGLDQVGGQDANLDLLRSALTMILIAPEKAGLYGLSGRQTLFMWGPPGCGKTLMAKVVLAELQRLTGRQCRFAVCKPAEWENAYVGKTQENIRHCFQALREAAEDGFAVLFLDEVETIGRIRGSAVGHHSDKFLGALLAEINGFTDRSGVAIVAASNRKDLIDPALLERLSDMEIHVTRPDLRGARAIFRIHLPEVLPYSPNGSAARATREEMIETAVSRLYSPNAENELCTLRFRDGKTRLVTAREMVSGRVIEQVCRAARQAAFLRDVRGGEPGLCVTDIEHAISQAMERLRSTLTVWNVHAYLSDLPQDIDVVSVDPVVRRVTRVHRYLNVA